MVPDLWHELSSPANTTYDPGVDVYIPPSAGSATMTGYQPSNSVGVETTLHEGDPKSAISPSDFYDIDVGTGANDVRNAINGTSCFPQVEIGQTLTTQPGAETGPNMQGVTDLIAQDPRASWGTSCSCVENSAFTTSPRIVPIAMFSPVEFTDATRTTGTFDLHIVNLGAFFVEDVANGRGGQSITRRFVSAVGVFVPGGPTPASGTSFLNFVSLVR